MLEMVHDRHGCYRQKWKVLYTGTIVDNLECHLRLIQLLQRFLPDVSKL